MMYMITEVKLGNYDSSAVIVLIRRENNPECATARLQHYLFLRVLLHFIAPSMERVD